MNGPDHLPLREEAEVAAVGGAARVLECSLASAAKSLPALALFRTAWPWRAPLALAAASASAGDRDQDVAGAHLFRAGTGREVLLVERFDLLGLDRHLRPDLGLEHPVDHQVLAGIRSQLLEGHLLAGQRLREGFFRRELLRICAMRASISASGTATLRAFDSWSSSLAANHLVEHAAEDAVALVGGTGDPFASLRCSDSAFRTRPCSPPRR